jgi:predicted  nucleic acid-binding Zn-ribbon protein
MEKSKPTQLELDITELEAKIKANEEQMAKDWDDDRKKATQKEIDGLKFQLMQKNAYLKSIK